MMRNRLFLDDYLPPPKMNTSTYSTNQLIYYYLLTPRSSGHSQIKSLRIGSKWGKNRPGRNKSCISPSNQSFPLQPPLQKIRCFLPRCPGKESNRIGPNQSQKPLRTHWIKDTTRIQLLRARAPWTPTAEQLRSRGE